MRFSVGAPAKRNRQCSERTIMTESNATNPRWLRSSLFAVLAGAGVAIGFVTASLLIEGPSSAARTATTLVMPLGMIWLLLLIAGIWLAMQRQWLVAAGCGVLFLVLTVVGNGYVASRFIHRIELPEQPVSATPDKPYRAVVVLGGAAFVNDYGTTEVQRAGERILSAAQLWHSGVVAAIVCTGSGPTGKNHPHQLGAELLQSLGVPNEVIFHVDGENTSQEMEHLREFFGELPDTFPTTGEFALITSAYHMRRALRLAETQQLAFAPLPCGYLGTATTTLVIRRFIPSAAAFDEFSMTLREHFAALVGR